MRRTPSLQAGDKSKSEFVNISAPARRPRFIHLSIGKNSTRADIARS
jgi:hypothetical protein